MKTFNDLKEFMSGAKNVQDWNSLREDAKGEFPVSLIRQLDGSGYIKECIRK